MPRERFVLRVRFAAQIEEAVHFLDFERIEVCENIVQVVLHLLALVRQELLFGLDELRGLRGVLVRGCKASGVCRGSRCDCRRLQLVELVQPASACASQVKYGGVSLLGLLEVADDLLELVECPDLQVAPC